MPFQIFVRTNRTLVFNVSERDTVATLKQAIADREGIPVRGFWLQHGWRVLSDEMTLSFYQIEAGSTVMCHVRGHGFQKIEGDK